MTPYQAGGWRVPSPQAPQTGRHLERRGSGPRGRRCWAGGHREGQMDGHLSNGEYSYSGRNHLLIVCGDIFVLNTAGIFIGIH